MKHLVLIGDGMADFPLPDHDGRTPLELAATPAMDELVRSGLSGLFCPIPEGFPPGSDIGNLSLFGYDPHTTFTGRAPLEAAQQGITLTNRQIALRCNLVTLSDGCMEDFTAQHISTEEADKLIVALNDAYAADPIQFHTGVSYRHLAILTIDPNQLDDYDSLACTPPHDITGQPYEPYLPSGSVESHVRDLMNRSHAVLADHPVNQARIAAGKRPATSIWLWGQGRAPELQSYADLFGLTGAVISAVDLIKGIGVCAGLEVIEVPGATGYLDTNYRGKTEAALQALQSKDVVYVHVEAPDEASHEGILDTKLRAIEDFDAKVVAPCFDALRHRDDCRILVAPDHITALSTRTHAHGPVPFVVCGAGVLSNRLAAYSEREAARGGIQIDQGWQLTPFLFTHPTVDAASLR